MKDLFNWDDLKFILAVSRAGNLREAAQQLRVNPTTMSRRLRAMEDAAGTALFDKLTHGVMLSDAGAQLVEVAEEVESLVHDVDARIHGRDEKLEGTLRVTSTHHLLTHWAQDLRDFCEAHPSIDLELTSNLSLANMTRREADIAVRIAPEAPPHLIGRQHGTVRFAVVGHRDLVARVGTEAPLSSFPWVSWDLSVGRWTDGFIAHNAKGARVVVRVDAAPMMVEAVRAGIGLVILPAFTAAAFSELVEVRPAGAAPLWVLSHENLKGSARVQAFKRFLTGLIERDRELIQGPESAHLQI